MKQRIKSSSKSLPLIVDTSKKAPKIEKSTIAKSLNTEEVQNIGREIKGSPLQVFAWHQELYERLRSTGGRRSLEGVSRRQKIPLTEEDWEVLQKLAEESQNEKVHPSPAQIASVLLHQALKELKQK